MDFIVFILPIILIYDRGREKRRILVSEASSLITVLRNLLLFAYLIVELLALENAVNLLASMGISLLLENLTTFIFFFLLQSSIFSS